VEPGGFTLDRVPTGTTPLPDRTTVGVRFHTAAAPTSWLALTAVGDFTTDVTGLEHATAEVLAGRFGLWGGRRPIGWAPGEGGGLVLSALDRFDGAGLRLARPWSVPVVGPVTGEVMAGPVGANGHVDAAWLLAARLHARPHPRLDLGLTRAALFGGLEGARPGPVQIGEVLIGANLGDGYADDQVASADLRWRPPVPFPAELYGEWGLHDIDFGVLIDVPAYTVGLRLPRAFGAVAGLALEHTRISAACCNNPPWYRHFELADGWAVDGAALGHPLGGHGEEWRVGASGAAGRSAALVVDVGAALRWRGGENVYAPERTGHSGRFELAADARLGPRASAGLEVAAERGEGWRELGARVIARLRF
jgi:Capsule assembly protein Wzi